MTTDTKTQDYTFTLRKINKKKLKEQYLNTDEVESIDSIPKGGKIHVKNDRISEENDMSNEKYMVNINGAKYVIATTNTKIYKDYRAGNDYVCNWCRSKFNHQPLGVPISISDDGDRNIIHMDGAYCCTNCVLSGCKSSRKYTITHETYVEKLHEILHPGTVLTEARDWTLHKNSYGSLSDKEFHRGNTRVCNIPSSYVFAAAKAQHRIDKVEE